MLAALVLAAAVNTGAPPVLKAPAQRSAGLVVSPRCGAAARPVAAVRSPPRPRKLDELPPAVGVRLVNKTVNGCPVLVLMERGPDGRPLERGLAAPPRLTPAESTAQRRSERQR